MLDRDRPYLVSVSYPCKFTSVLNKGLNFRHRTKQEVDDYLAEGKTHHAFTMQVCEYQARPGR